jgi:hypothetical protein
VNVEVGVDPRGDPQSRERQPVELGQTWSGHPPAR